MKVEDIHIGVKVCVRVIHGSFFSRKKIEEIIYGVVESYNKNTNKLVIKPEGKFKSRLITTPNRVEKCKTTWEEDMKFMYINYYQSDGELCTIKKNTKEVFETLGREIDKIVNKDD